MPIIVGLGNPGRKYVGTRHNIGFRFIDQLADSLSIRMGLGKGPFHIGKASRAGKNIYLVKPTTYMNNSGDAVRQVINWYKTDIDSCMICYDDLNLDIGTIRLRPGGSAGGHNGIKDIIQKLGTDNFPRLRFGIGNEFPKGQQVNYVLSPFSDEEEEAVDDALNRATDAVFTYVRNGIEQAMNDYN